MKRDSEKPASGGCWRALCVDCALEALAVVRLVVAELVSTLRTSVGFVHFTSFPFIRPL